MEVKRKNKKKVLKKGSVDGRPPLTVDWEKLDQLCMIQCTMEEIAAVMDISISALSQHCKKERNRTFKEIYEEKRAVGKRSLRRAQWQTALGRTNVYDNEGHLVQSEIKPNPTMMIFLGKQYLDQRDIWEHRGKDGAPLFPESVDDFKELSELCNEYGIDIRTNGKNGRKGKHTDETPKVQGHLPEGPGTLDK